ncbi:MAG: type II secretion system protein [Methylophilus sp.]|nr:type II secretion system protein [Methylophilus sp.]
MKTTKPFGFTFIGLLMVIAISGIALAGIGIVWHQSAQRERESELLYVGNQYSKAISNYYLSSPTNPKQYPKSLEDLLLDKRFQNKRRHLRKLYPDPMTHGKPWGLIKQQDQIIGVYSMSKETPIKTAQFQTPYESFAEAKTYHDWKFMPNASN